MNKALSLRLRSIAIPAEDAARQRSEIEENLHGAACGREAFHRQEAPNIGHGSAGAASRKLDHPDIMQRNAR